MGFARDAFVTTSGRVVSVALSLGVASASAWLLGPEKRGELAIYIVCGTLLALATSSGVEMAGAYYGGTKKYPLVGVIFAEILIIFIAVIVSSGVACILWLKSPAFVEKVSLVGLMISVGYVPAMLANTSFWYLHVSLGHTITYCLGSVFTAAFTLLGILLLCWRDARSEAAMFAYLAAEFMTAVFLFTALMRQHGFTGIILQWRCVKDLYAYGFRYYFARMAQFLNVQIGTFVIAFMGTRADTGYFAAAIGLVAKLTIVPEILGAVLLSRVVKEQHTSLELTARVVRMVFWVILFVSLVLAALCKPIVWIILSPEFLPVVIPVWFLLPGMLVRCCSKTLGVYFNGIGRPEINSVAIGAAVVTNVVLMYFLLPLYGIKGAAIAASCGYLADAGVLITVYRFVFRHPVSLLIPRISDIRYLSKVVLSKITD